MKRRSSPRQEAYIRGVATGMTHKSAALQAGYSEATAAGNSKMLKSPVIREALADIQKKGRELVAYDLAQALKDCDRAAEFSRANKNSMALVKACELKSKLAGLLVERVETVNVNISAALAEARLRARLRAVPTLIASDEDLVDPFE